MEDFCYEYIEDEFCNAITEQLQNNEKFQKMCDKIEKELLEEWAREE